MFSSVESGTLLNVLADPSDHCTGRTVRKRSGPRTHRVHWCHFTSSPILLVVFFVFLDDRLFLDGPRGRLVFGSVEVVFCRVIAARGKNKKMKYAWSEMPNSMGIKT